LIFISSINFGQIRVVNLIWKFFKIVVPEIYFESISKIFNFLDFKISISLFSLALSQILAYFIKMARLLEFGCKFGKCILQAVILLLLCGMLAMFCPHSAGADTPQGDTAKASRQLEQLRKEIKEFENKIAASRTREKDLLDELADYEKEINLRRKLINQLKQEVRSAQRSLKQVQSDLAEIDNDISQILQDSLRTSNERESLAALVMRRAVYAYKYQKRDVLKALLLSQSVVQMLTRQKYLKRIAEVDRLNLERLDRKNMELRQLRQQLSTRKVAKSNRLAEYQRIADYKNKMLDEEQSETQLLAKRRKEREDLLNKVKKDQALLRQQLTEKKLAAQRVENFIKTLEAEREALPERPLVTWAPEVPFRNLKGKMNWPTSGKVVTKFGLQRNQQFDTVTENPGIEIEAPEGDPVYAVCTGQVTKITWLRGYGNTIIIDHQEGYYTVYAHLGDINVREGQVVLAGEYIGTIGQTGTLSGPRLHFEIWAKREKQDPLTWLTGK